MLDIILNIFTSGLPCCLLALGIFLTYRLLDFADLTAEGSFLLGAAVSGVMIYNGINPWIATLCSILVGAASGALTGILNRLVKIPKLLSGIITMTAAASIALLIMGAANENESLFKSQVTYTTEYGGAQQTIYSLLYPYQYNEIYDMYIVVSPWGDIIKVAVMLAVVALVMLIIYFFFGTEYGMAIRATGMNETMARAQGINTDLAVIICVTIANALIALAGSLFSQDIKSVSAISAQGYLVVGLASIIIGEAIFGKKTFKNWLISVALGSIMYFIIITVAIRLGLPTELKSLLYAILIVIALLIPLLKSVITNAIKKSKMKKEAKNV